MRALLGVYGINGLGFLANVGAVFVYAALAGPTGYGAYSVYFVLMSVFFLYDSALVKTALGITERLRGDGAEAAQAEGGAARFLNRAILAPILLSPLLVYAGTLLFPHDPVTGVGGGSVMVIVIAEHLLSYPANRLTHALALRKRFAAVYGLRLAGTLMRHAFAWTVLILTGSIFAAIAAILLKGVVIGAIALVVTRRQFAVPRSGLRHDWRDAATLASFFGAAFCLIALQEIPSVYLDHAYGRDVLGAYRLLYDLSNAVWFIAAIYPTVLFTWLLPPGGRLDPAQACARMIPLGEGLALFHLAYGLGFVTLIGLERLVVGQFFAGLPYATGVVAGVALLGYNRFLMEAAQAYGRGRSALAATIGAIAVAVLILGFSPSAPGAAQIGHAWLVSQVALFIALKAILWLALRPGAPFWRDALLLPLPLIAVSAASAAPALLLPMTVAACLAGLAAGLAVAVRLWAVRHLAV